jgi:hypothetical protein
MNAQVFTTTTSAPAASAGDLVPGLFGQTKHHFRIDEILGAAKGNKADFHQG